MNITRGENKETAWTALQHTYCANFWIGMLSNHVPLSTLI
jgi:hypothetical protein